MTEQDIARALAAISPGNIEQMAYSPFSYDPDGNPVYASDEDEEANLQAEDEYPMQSLARAIVFWATR